MIKRAVAIALMMMCAGCAVVKSPLPPYPIVFIGWGKLEISHEKKADGVEVFILRREINTSEVLGEIVAAGGTIVSIMAMCL